MSYHPWAVVPGVYKHHTGSSSSTNNNSWIFEIRRAWGVLDEGNPLDDSILKCAAAGCKNTSSTHRFEGCHLRESKLKELLAIFGIGGTPVVALCSSCHNKSGAAIRLGSIGMGIIDQNCPPDFSSSNPTKFESIECTNCRTFDTKGPDDDGDFYCSTCNHHIDSDGECVTDNCCSAFKDPNRHFFCSCANNCDSHYKSRCPQPPAKLCFHNMCGICCDGTDCLRHSDHESYGRPGFTLLKKLNRKVGETKRIPYYMLLEKIEKKYSDGPLRNADPICRECGDLLYTPPDDDWKCVNKYCSQSH